MARLLTDAVGRGGKYEGFDIDHELIAWCRENIASAHPDFHFQHAAVFNKAYAHAGGKASASEFVFPYEDASFDLVFAKSVFTHLLPEATENYLAQTARVLKKGCKAVLTFFLLTDRSRELIRSGKSSLAFRHAFGPCLAIREDVPEAAVAYEERFVSALFEKHGLRLARPVLYGSWPDQSIPNATYQDIALLVKQ